MSTPKAAELEVLSPGNPIRLRGVPLVFLGGLAAVVLMAIDASSGPMVAFAVLGGLVATVGVLDVLGTFDDEPCHAPPNGRALAAPAALTLAAGVFLILALRAAVSGRMGPMGAAFAVPSAMVATLAGGFRLFERLGPLRYDEQGNSRPLHRRHGFWLLALTIAIHVPLLGSHSLTDPWETHYGEVAREILSRGDWISLWWAEDGWFQSKPVLTFWLQAASMSLLGVRFAPGTMLDGIGRDLTPHPEWALRLPSTLFMLVGLYLLYRGVVKTAGRRAAFIGGVVLVTMPQFLFVARQAMTDMPFVAGMMGCVGCVLLAAHTAEHTRARAFALPLGLGMPRVSAFHLVFGIGIGLVMMQACYLASRNLMIATQPYFDIRFVGDTFAQGSPGNCGTPGNVACIEGLMPTQDRLQPALQGFIWLQATALLCWLSWGERRLKRLLYLGAWLCAAVATMSKGVGGLALPMTGVFLWVVATGRWRELTRMEIVGGVMLFAVVAVPWFAASYARHGRVFIDRLFFDHMVKRTFGEMHHTNKGVDVSFRYYVWQLGYATFPWAGLAPIALVSWFKQRGARWSGSCLLAANFAVGFALFSLMGTKFHHYSVPLLPPLAMLTGVLLDDMLRRETRGTAWGGVAIGAALATFVIGVDLAWSAPGRRSAVRLLHLFTYKYTRPWPEHLSFDGVLWAFVAVGVIAIASLAWQRRRGFGVVSLGTVACLFAMWLADGYMMEVAPHWGQRELLVRFETERVEQDGRLVAYQMNWKGENFYRGNSIAAFKTSGAKFQEWVDDQRRLGERTFYFLTEHKRVPSLSAELGNPKNFEKLTDKRLNNKFALVRVRY